MEILSGLELSVEQLELESQENVQSKLVDGQRSQVAEGDCSPIFIHKVCPPRHVYWVWLSMNEDPLRYTFHSLNLSLELQLVGTLPIS